MGIDNQRISLTALHPLSWGTIDVGRTGLFSTKDKVLAEAVLNWQ